MKMMMLSGAAIGFAVGITFSLLRASAWPTVVWQACVAAYVSGMMFRWWGRQWTRNLRLALVEKQQAAVREAVNQPVADAAAPVGRGHGLEPSASGGATKR
ncbi:MAG: hypothetical protein AB7O66_10835 [Limisphaerales bacterium]